MTWSRDQIINADPVRLPRAKARWLIFIGIIKVIWLNQRGATVSVSLFRNSNSSPCARSGPS